MIKLIRVETSSAIKDQNRVTRLLTGISITFISAFAILIFILHFLRPGLAPLHRPTSEYAVGQYGYLMSAAFICMSIATITLIISFTRSVNRNARSTIGLVFLTIWSVAVLIAMLFPIDAEGAVATRAGRIHTTNGPIAFLSLTLGVLLVSLRFKRDEYLRDLYPTALVLAVMMILLFVSVAVSFNVGLGYEGLLQRLYLIIVVTWFILVLHRLYKKSTV